jgi:hypothetical protein
VKDGLSYPAVLFLAGANDPRVDPMQSRKMTARLQAATSSKAPVLLRTSDTSGHGNGTSLSERIADLADVYAFFFKQLGVKVAAGSFQDLKRCAFICLSPGTLLDSAIQPGSANVVSRVTGYSGD